MNWFDVKVNDNNNEYELVLSVACKYVCVLAVSLKARSGARNTQLGVEGGGKWVSFSFIFFMNLC